MDVPIDTVMLKWMLHWMPQQTTPDSTIVAAPNAVICRICLAMDAPIDRTTAFASEKQVEVHVAFRGMTMHTKWESH